MLTKMMSLFTLTFTCHPFNRSTSDPERIQYEAFAALNLMAHKHKNEKVNKITHCAESFPVDFEDCVHALYFFRFYILIQKAQVYSNFDLMYYPRVR